MSYQPDDPSAAGMIRITREETATNHVDDLLKRQMSLRGQIGVTRDRHRWYYQNWFVFMIAGTMAAVAAWAIIEPFFDDCLYLQGVVEDVNEVAEAPDQISFGDHYLKLKAPAHGFVRLCDERVWFLDQTRELRRDGAKPVVTPSAFHTGQTIGVYVEYHELGSENLALARYVQFDPPKLADAAHLTLHQLQARSEAAGMLLFSIVAGLIGLAIGAADGIVCRLPRRALLGGAVGLAVGFVGGFVSHILANLAYTPLSRLAMEQSPGIHSMTTFAFVIQMTARSLGWCLAGMTAGLGQGIALRSRRLLLYGFLGGIVGGLLGGLLFDPIDLLLLGPDKPSAHWSRLIGFTAIGASVGAMIGLVEMLARDVWLRMTEGPLAGKEFLLFKDLMQIGASPRSDIYLFNDPSVAPRHATLRAIGDDCELESADATHLVLVNDRPVRSVRLRHGDRIGIGRTVFVFQKRKS